MRFLANENFPGAAVAALEAAGHEIERVRVAAPGAPDPEVQAWAARKGRVLLTFDKDFGELARASRLPQNCGVELLRVRMPEPGEARRKLAEVILS
jgi:predicted nuclease of predicted toxin-antitoxin system